MANPLLNHRLKMYLEAEKEILSGAQSYTIDGRLITKANLAEIRNAINELIAQGATVEEIENKKISKAKRVLFVDS